MKFVSVTVLSIGAFSTIAGYQTQFLTHSIDIEAGRQRSRPIVIGEYCFVGTQSVLLGGSVIPSFSVLGAKSLLADSFVEPYWLYGGVPAKPIKPLNHKAAYFCRAIGHVE